METALRKVYIQTGVICPPSLGDMNFQEVFTPLIERRKMGDMIMLFNYLTGRVKVSKDVKKFRFSNRNFEI